MNSVAEVAPQPHISEPPVRAEPLLLDFTGAAALLGIGRTLFYQMVADGRCPVHVLRFGRRSLVRAAELRAWVAADCPPRGRWMTMQEACP